MLQTPNTADQINNVIDHLASKLAVPTARLWEILVRQSYVMACVSLMDVLLYSAVVGGLLWGVRFCYQRYAHSIATQKKDFADLLQPGMPWIFAMMGLGIALVIALNIVVGNLNDAIGQFGNPQYYALHEILSALK